MITLGGVGGSETKEQAPHLAQSGKPEVVSYLVPPHGREIIKNRTIFGNIKGGAVGWAGTAVHVAVNVGIAWVGTNGWLAIGVPDSSMRRAAGIGVGSTGVLPNDRPKKQHRGLIT